MSSLLICILQIEVKHQEAGEMTMNNTNNLAFIHFRKNYTKDLIKYISREKDRAKSSTYIHLTNESKYAIQLLIWHISNIFFKTSLLYNFRYFV